MKKTEYFHSIGRNISQVNLTIEEVTKKRDKFILDNKNKILNIENENIQFVSNNSYTIAILSITFYQTN